MADTGITDTLTRLDAVKDAMAVRRVFGDPYEFDGIEVIPVASIRGGGGGGGSTATDDAHGAPAGAGMGFGVDARPVGVLIVKDGSVSWRPTVDATRIALNGQRIGAILVAVIGALLVMRAAAHRRQ